MADRTEFTFECRQSIWGPVGLTVIFMVIPAVVKSFVDTQAIFFISIACSILLSVLAWRIAKAALYPTNWVIKGTVGGIYIKIRSYLNFQLSADDKVVVYIPYGDILTAEEVEERHQSKGFLGLTKTESRTHLNLVLKHNDAEKIVPYIHAEVYREPPEQNQLAERVNHLHVQVQVHGPEVLQIPWYDRNTRINPDLRVVFRHLAERGVKVLDGKEAAAAVPPSDDLYSESA